MLDCPVEPILLTFTATFFGGGARVSGGAAWIIFTTMLNEE